MADANVPIKFEIYKGDQLVREEVLAQSPIKIGKLASSDLRLDDETVSRMHGVIEATGPGDVHVVDLGSTRGTTVNGERVTKARLQSGDEVMFGDCRVIVTFGDAIAVAGDAGARRRGDGAPSGAATRRRRWPTRPRRSSSTRRRPSSRMPPSPSSPTRPPSFAGAPGAGAEVEVHDGSRAMEVQTIFRGVVTGTRHLFNPEGKNTHGQGTSMLYAGLGGRRRSAIGMFVATAMDVGAEKARFEQWQRPARSQELHLEGPLRRQRRASCSAASLAGIVAGVHGPQAPRQDQPELPRRLRRRRRRAGLVRVRAVVVAPAGRRDRRRLRRQRHPAHDRRGVRRQPELPAAAVHPAARAPASRCPQGGSARLDCGETTFVVTATPRPRTLDVPFLTWRWDEQIYTVGSAVALGLFLLMIFSVPPDPKSLSLDLFNSDNRFVKFLIKPPEEKEEDIPEWLKSKKDDEQGGKGKRHKGEEGKMGKKTSKNKEGLYGLKGPKDNPDPHLAKKLAEEQAKNAGILGVLKQTEGSHIASIFGRDTALGNDAADVLGGLIGNQIGEAYGVGGLGLVGTGSGGGGTGEGTIGLGNLGTIGKGGGGGNGSGYGRGAGGLGGRRAKAPDVIPGQANVRGSLDKEIIRRIIRRHINEVKYCYEQELTKKPDLGGRIMVQFTIAASGQVIASVLQNSTMGNARVENCTVQAVRRWEFPKPLGGGIVIVSYPFVLTPAGGGE